ncbi:MAG: hypothetical protein WA172_10135 [Terriglobales bacterium]
MDATQQLAWDSEICSAILLNPVTQDFAFIALPSSPEALSGPSGCGLCFVGVIALRDERVTLALDDPAHVSFETAKRISVEFTRRLIVLAADPLERLYQLPDTRG